LRRLLGATFGGVLGSDRLPTSTAYASGQRQFCGSHFTSNLLSAQELAKTASAKRFCREALALQRRLFRLWHRFRDDPPVRGGPITRQQLIAKAGRIEKAFFALGLRYVNTIQGDVSNLARAMVLHTESFLTFIYEDGVDPTNNASERAALRHAVQGRAFCAHRRGGRASVCFRAIVRRAAEQKMLCLMPIPRLPARKLDHSA